MKRMIRLAPVFCALLLFLISCKAKKAALDATSPTDDTEVLPPPQPVTVPVEKEAPTKKPEKPAPTLDDRLTGYFGEIANASSVTMANNNIREALGLFSTADAPVLIIFYTANGQEDFDEPTTISKYLNYLKDQGKNPHKVKEMVTDNQGRIKELVLVKK